MFGILSSVFTRNRSSFQLVFSLCLLAGLAWSAQAATFTVTTAADNGDNVNPTPGSLRAAINSANNTPGTDKISFSIGTGIQTITPLSALPKVTDPVIIDGTTQPGFAGSPIIEISGASAGQNVIGLNIAAGNSTIKGLVINGFSGNAGIDLNGLGNNVVCGNYIGTNLAGTAELGNFLGVYIHSPNNTIGGTTPAERNIISGNESNSGVGIGGQNATGNLIVGNYLGTDVTGTIAIGNNIGVYIISGASNNTVGGATPAARNIISGNFSSGVGITSNGNKVWGNFIGTKADGTSELRNQTSGVDIIDGHDNSIGGAAPGQGNVIHFNGFAGPGVLVHKGSSISRNAVLGNSIYSSGRLGIDLGGDGVTPNDQGDVDTGPLTANEFQNYPVLTSITANGSNTDIKGTLNSLANTQFRLEFFSNSLADPSGFGEGQTFLGSTNVTTDGSGNVANFTFTIPTASIVGGLVSATATDANNNTSEFSQVLATPGNGAGVLEFGQVSYNCSEGVGSATVMVKRTGGSTGIVSVSFATSNGSATAPADYADSAATIVMVDGQTLNPISIPIVNDNLIEPQESFLITLSNPTNGATLGAQQSAEVFIADDDSQAPSTIQFKAGLPNVQENLGALTISVTRTGNTSSSASVEYSTKDGTATQKGDFEYAAGRLTFAPGETEKTFQVLLNEDMYLEGIESFGLTLSNPVGTALGQQSTATVSITDDAPESITNPIDDAQSFVYMQYHDFLNREPDAGGLAFWTNEITSCGGDQQCIDTKRVNVSAAFFLSIEFQQTGYLVYRTYKAALGGLPGAPVPVNLNDFMPDTQEIGKGVVVNQAGWQQVLENNKQAYFAEFVRRPLIDLEYPIGTPAQLVDAFFYNAHVTPSVAERQAAIDEFGGAATSADHDARARALRRVAENPTLAQQEFNKAFVLMQYFGYLRRNPNDAPEPGLNYDGYNFWLNKLNQFNGNFQNAEMVKAFIISGEYRQRFGP